MKKEKKEEGVRMTFYLKRNVQEQIIKRAKKDNRTMSNYVQTLLEKVFEI